jgi:hypothetical protein
LPVDHKAKEITVAPAPALPTAQAEVAEVRAVMAQTLPDHTAEIQVQPLAELVLEEQSAATAETELLMQYLAKQNGMELAVVVVAKGTINLV